MRDGADALCGAVRVARMRAAGVCGGQLEGDGTHSQSAGHRGDARMRFDRGRLVAERLRSDSQASFVRRAR